MNENDWSHLNPAEDTSVPCEETRNQAVFTLFLRDFLQMPEVDFSKIAAADPYLRAMYN